MRTRLFSVAVLATSSLFVVACSYDFDKFTPLEATGSSTNGSGGAAAGASGSSMSSGSPGGASGSSMSTGPGAGGAAGASSGGTAGSAGSEGTDAAVDSSAMKEGGADSDAGMSDVRADNATDAPPPSDAADVKPGEPDASAVADAPVDTGSCPPPAECSCESYNGHAYRFCTTTRSWVDSESQCAQAGMRLARVDDALENGFIRATADAHGMAEIWIGIQDPTTTLHWQWPDGTQFWSGDASGTPVGGLYSNWSASKPTGTPVKNCGSMLSSASAGGWQDRSCTSLLAYVCELY